MEDAQKAKRIREVGFENIRDPTTRLEIKALVGCPEDATNFSFWYSKVEPSSWGLTIKSIPKVKGMFTSQHTWKITWYCRGSDPEPKLTASRESQSIAVDISGPKFERIKEIFESYRAK